MMLMALQDRTTLQATFTVETGIAAGGPSLAYQSHSKRYSKPRCLGMARYRFTEPIGLIELQAIPVIGSTTAKPDLAPPGPAGLFLGPWGPIYEFLRNDA